MFGMLAFLCMGQVVGEQQTLAQRGLHTQEDFELAVNGMLTALGYEPNVAVQQRDEYILTFEGTSGINEISGYFRVGGSYEIDWLIVIAVDGEYTRDIVVPIQMGDDPYGGISVLAAAKSSLVCKCIGGTESCTTEECDGITLCSGGDCGWVTQYSGGCRG